MDTQYITSPFCTDAIAHNEISFEVIFTNT